jgi:hypothetical protein
MCSTVTYDTLYYLGIECSMDSATLQKGVLYRWSTIFHIEDNIKQVVKYDMIVPQVLII